MERVMLKRVTRQEADVYHLPGRDFLLYISGANSDAKNLAFGVVTFPAGSAPDGHIHPAEEEIIHVISGTGALVTPEGTAQLDPGTTVYIPPGLHHATACTGSEPLVMVSVFSPPVIPGSYEQARQ
jgi:oxalate decarboxylase/phosphoglucose isomerase-like protein (cupin superfamily)